MSNNTEKKESKTLQAEMHTRIHLPQPALYRRDKYGLIQGVNYVFNEDNSIDWRAMVNPKYLYPNAEWFTKRDESVPKDIDGLEDAQLLIKLAGIKELAKLRGFSRVSFSVLDTSTERAVVECSMCFIPNYETDGREVWFSSVANATLSNTGGVGMKFLESIAENRAFVRCVRNFLNVHIVGDDEIDEVPFKAAAPEQPFTGMPSPDTLLKDILATKHNVFTWDEFKTVLRRLWTLEKYRNEEASGWEGYSDIPPSEKRKLIQVLKEISDD